MDIRIRIVTKNCSHVYYPDFCLWVHGNLPRLKLAIVSSIEKASVPRVTKRFLLLFWH